MPPHIVAAMPSALPPLRYVAGALMLPR